MNLIDFHKDAFWITDVGLVRSANEDNCYAAETPNGFLFVVCDGMGGHVGGAEASTIAVKSIVDFFTKKHIVVRQALTEALAFANKQILSVAAERPELKGMGTTACVLLLQDDKAWYVHIGDSRIYLFCNKQQQLHRLTKDHSVVQGLVDQGIICEAEAEHHPDKNRILKALGIHEEIQPEVCVMPVLPAKGDIFLICSDGLSGMVSDEVLQHILKQKIPLQEKGVNMLSLSKQAGGTDNITIQLIQVSNSPHKRSIFESKNSSFSTSPQKNKKRLFVPIITGVILVLIVLTAVFVIKSSKKTKNTNTSVTNIAAETLAKPAWERERVKRGYIFLIERGGKKIYGEKLIFDVSFEAMYVNIDGSYNIAKISIPKDGTNFTLSDNKIEKYNKDGILIQ
ncbi:MAG: Stp1/IreP family PP2C-type Ser/Thr phosphatase [Candidatus Azobacteroides sp.]|nr:Stp1/IreP family PP2C-type Ser/Thr phosphatase [Candidatus Azobacteroides sp.]